MKRINRKKLNNKGFTLIELLAVVVILAVVMGIAMNSVLSSMNNSRMGSLVNSAESTAQIFQSKYAEAMVVGETATTLKLASPAFGGYNFAVPASVTAPYYYTLNANLSAELNLSKTNYKLATASEVVQSGTKYENEVTMSDSFVVFDGNRLEICLIVPNSSSYYVGQATKAEDTTITILGKTFKIAKETMFACSNEVNSWED